MADSMHHKLSRREVITGVLSVSTSILLPRTAFADSLVVFVNPSVSENVTKSDLSLIFTTRKQEWSGGRPIKAFNFPPKHEFRVDFDSKVLGMDADAVARYWIDRRIRGGNAPPTQVPAAATIVKLVEKFEGAIGYAPKSALGSASVRIVLSL